MTIAKRILALVLCALMTLGCLAACSDYDYPIPTAPIYTGPKYTMPPSLDDLIGENTEPTEAQPAPTQPAATEPAPTEPAVPEGTLVPKAGEEISYVMIYNPQIYTDDAHTESRQTGSISQQITVEMNRGDNLGNLPETDPFSQVELDPAFISKINLDGGKADGLGKFYSVGDKENFYCGSQKDINTREERSFTCVYAGTHANIWTYEKVDQNTINKLGKAFDETTYQNCVDRFGEARFGEVVNILIYPFSGNQNTVGFFCGYDLFSSMECDDATAKLYGVNRNINVININQMWLADETTTISTLAHEFQHLLCFTGYFAYGNQCAVWFNEAMSGYIEEVLYPGIKASHFETFHTSARIRNGQSLYNFGIDATSSSFDIGVYGSVFLFSEYLKNLSGNDIFSKFHSNWRRTYSEMDTFTGIYNVVPENVRQQVDSLVQYPSSVRFASREQEWCSKLTLSFYLSTFTADQNAAAGYKNIAEEYLVYDSLRSANIEGGGRILLATKGGTFQIPEDADAGLVYVGLNKDLQIVTNIVTK